MSEARSAAVTWAFAHWATWMVVVATPADVQDLLAGRQAGKLQQLLGGAAAASVGLVARSSTDYPTGTQLINRLLE
jgi:hypothetical protein